MKLMVKQNPPEYRQEIVLLDGRRAVMRPINSEDKSALQDFYSRLSQETRFLRFHYSKSNLSESDLNNFCDVDYNNTFGLVAEIKRECRCDIVGVGRYSRLPDYYTAEIAFVVEDNEQKKGIATHLLKHLTVLAWERDIRYFFAEVVRNNVRMLSIFKKFDPQMEIVLDGSSCSLVLSLDKAFAYIESPEGNLLGKY